MVETGQVLSTVWNVLPKVLLDEGVERPDVEDPSDFGATIGPSGRPSGCMFVCGISCMVVSRNDWAFVSRIDWAFVSGIGDDRRSRSVGRGNPSCALGLLDFEFIEAGDVSVEGSSTS
jgi:hypothetical protein